MEQITRKQVKQMLVSIAIALLCVQLISIALQQRATNINNGGLPTLSAVSSAQDSDVLPTMAAVNNAQGMTQAACTATVRAQMLNQRSGPGESYDVIGGASQGEAFTIVGWDDNRRWAQVHTTNGAVWMAARYLRLTNDCNTTSGNNTVARADSPEVAAIVATPIPQRTLPAGNTTAGMVTTAVELSSVFTPEVLYWSDEIAAWAETYALDANLIATVIQIESCGNASIHSSAGAQGLFQVMPFHFTAGENMLDVETNAHRGLTYLQGALKLSGGEVGLALVGYNGGYGAITGNRAAETQRYYYWGSGIYEEATSGMTTSPTLQEWLAAGGASLCTKARQSQQSGL